MQISGFFGEYRFLSNFWPAPIAILGIPYKNVEAAYQASKTPLISVRKQFSDLSPKQARSMGRQLILPSHWDQICKMSSMELCLRAKFAIPQLKARLISTDGCELIEANTWGDEFWGQCNGKGRNILGKMLMILRDELVMYYSLESAVYEDRPAFDDSDDIPF